MNFITFHFHYTIIIYNSFITILISYQHYLHYLFSTSCLSSGGGSRNLRCVTCFYFKNPYLMVHSHSSFLGCQNIRWKSQSLRNWTRKCFVPLAAQSATPCFVHWATSCPVPSAARSAHNSKYMKKREVRNCKKKVTGHSRQVVAWMSKVMCIQKKLSRSVWFQLVAFPLLPGVRRLFFRVCLEEREAVGIPGRPKSPALGKWALLPEEGTRRRWWWRRS